MKLKLVSLRELGASAKETISRFPLPSVLLLLGAANHLYMNIFETAAFKYYSRNLFMSILVLLPVLYSLQLFFESQWLAKRLKLSLELSAVGITLIYLFSLPNSQLLAYHFSQFWLYLSITFLLSFICIKNCIKDDDLFWHFHISLFSRFSIASVYTGVILAASSAALGAIDTLFKTKLLQHQEVRVVILTLWIFLPLFFLTGVPRFKNMDEILAFKPKWIKNIGIYVLLPFTMVYLGILYAYLGKIAILWKLPEGMVSYLVLSFAAFGIASLFVVYPFQKDENSKWSRWFGRLFYYLQFPLLVLLGIAIVRRVLDYGITFKRYYVIALSVWLLFITIYMVIRKNKDLIMIPFSLFIVALLSSFGPWNAFNVSFINQRDRLNGILTKYSLVQNGKLAKPNDEIPVKVKSEICSITKYLFDYGKLKTFSSLSNSTDTLTPKVFIAQLGFEWRPLWSSDYYENNEWFNYSFANDTYGYDKNDFDAFVKMNVQSWSDSGKNKMEMKALSVEYRANLPGFVISSPAGDSSVILLKDVIAEFQKESPDKSQKVNIYSFDDANFKIVCLFDDLTGRIKPEGLEMNAVNVNFLIKKKK
ncbi:DUF4153 domain-containing protein [candidate division TA06 bacterium]|nr:DUF4153 domain-containing protein [candidate division TA06 bacterium]